MMATPLGHGQETVCLRLDYLNGWLFTIESVRIKDELIRQRVQDYQRECYRVLFRHFTGDDRLIRAANETLPGLSPHWAGTRITRERPNRRPRGRAFPLLPSGAIGLNLLG